MATVKKIIVPRSQLIPVDGANQALVRFRILSDDRNRFSEWSSIFSLTSGGVLDIPSAIFRSGAIGSIVTVGWRGLPANTSFDIFVSNDDSPMLYEGTTSDNRYVFIISGEETYQFSIQRSSISKTYDPSLQIFESEVFNVV